MGNPIQSDIAKTGHKLSLPKHLMGRLIGKKGATIQELQRQTDCRVSCSSKSEEEDVSQVLIRGSSQEKEARCARAAQLLCDGRTLEDALAQADAELEEQRRFEASEWERQQRDEAVHRIMIQWSEFEEHDIRAALSEERDDEEKATDLLLSGYRAPCLQETAVPAVVDATSEILDRVEAATNDIAIVNENYPALPCRLPSSICTGQSWARTSKPCPSELTIENAFPDLPTPLQKPRRVPLSRVRKTRVGRC